MRRALSIVATLFVFTASGRADEPKTADELLSSFEGIWLEVEAYKLVCTKEPVQQKPLTKVDKLHGVSLTEQVRKGRSEWSVYVGFSSVRQGYTGRAGKVEVSGDTATFRLPPPGKDDDQRTTRSFRLKRAGEHLDLELLDGEFRGRYRLISLTDRKSSVAATEQTVYAVARVDGKTKTIDGQVYHLVAVRYRPSLEFRDPKLLVRGPLGQSELAETELELAGPDCLYHLFWLQLPEKGELEVIWADRDFPKERNEDLRARLIKAGHTPYKVDVQKLPTVKSGGRSENLLETLDKLAETLKAK